MLKGELFEGFFLTVENLLLLNILGDNPGVRPLILIKLGGLILDISFIVFALSLCDSGSISGLI